MKACNRTWVWLALIGAWLISGCSPDTNAQRAREMFAAFNRHDWPAMAACYAPEAQFLDPSFGTEWVTRSRQETAAKYAEMAQMFPDLKDSVQNVYVSGDHVIVQFVSTGTAGDSLSFALPICTVLTFQNGLIVRDATYYDQ